ncbi:MAG: HigA family addiction module antidote protein [Gemmatimonadetes bacterium]|nr:HigA family addiction module antidote protein [Gemmatimonadota bacterium]NNM04068.1 HigA family addiction module antidote protein [Gemmatimonadota bacterium]
MKRRLPSDRRPVHPGKVFLDEFLKPLEITQKEAARLLRISYPRMNEIIKGKRTVTPETALRLARLTGTDAESWLNLQQSVDLWDAYQSADVGDIKKIQPLTAA